MRRWFCSYSRRVTESVTRRWRGLLDRLPPFSIRRAAAGVVALSLLAGVFTLPASQILPEREEGERFGEIHWYVGE